MAQSTNGTRGRRVWWLVLALAVTFVIGTELFADAPTRRVSAAAPPASASVHDRPRPSPGEGGSASPLPRAKRDGRVGLVGLGDSVMAGSNCACDDYLTGLGRLLGARDVVPVSVINDGRSGDTAADLDGMLSDDRSARRDVASAEVVVVTIGANDLLGDVVAWRSGRCPTSCYQPGIDTMASHLASVIDKIKAIRGHAKSQILITDYWNVFADGDVAENTEDDGYLDWSDRVTRAANTAIGRVARDTGVTEVDLYSPFKPNPSTNPTHLLADDGDHPNAAGTALISATVLKSITPVG